jgi:hypothetical protein
MKKILVKDLVKIMKKTCPNIGRDYIWERIREDMCVFFNADFTDFCFCESGDVKVPGEIGMYSAKGKVRVKISLTKAEKIKVAAEKRKKREMRFFQREAMQHMANMGIKACRYYDGMLDFPEHKVWLTSAKILTLKNIDDFHRAVNEFNKGFASTMP